MKPLIVLISSFILAYIFILAFNIPGGYKFAGRIAMAGMLLFTAIGHFAFTKGMVMMIPPVIPFKKAIVYITGVLEIAAAVCLLIPQYAEVIGWLLIAFFILLIPANISAAMRKVDYQKGTYDGDDVSYLWFRVPLQALFILWTYISTSLSASIF
ncbi:MAG: hypothetical protein ABIN95_03260 [Mucilaginibacter sp.]